MARDDIAQGNPGAAERDSAGVPLIPGLSPSRRAFLKLVGFSFAGAVLPGCSRGEEHDAVPFLEKPESVTPGLTQSYATGCGGCDAGCGLLARVRDGRPIKLEGNDSHPLSKGRTCAVGQAQILALYDRERLRGPRIGGDPASWEVVDGRIRDRLAEVRESGKSVRLLTGTVNGPTMKAAIARFLADNPGAEHVSYDALSCAALADAHLALYGERVVPRYRLDPAHVIVSIDADFLGTWLSPVEFTRGYTEARSLSSPRSSFCRHVQVESRLSLTGSNADRRLRVGPDELAPFAFALASRVAKRIGASTPWSGAPKSTVDAAALDEIAEQLVGAPRGRALVLCGLNDERAQRATAWLNHALASDDPKFAERTVDLERPSQQALGDDGAALALVREIEAGTVGALFVMGCNPVYDLPGGNALGAALDRVPLVVSLAERVDETAAHAHVVCPDHDPLESWRDAEPVLGLFTLSQPTIQPIFDTRAAVESLAAFAGRERSAYDQMRDVWREQVLERSGRFEVRWAEALHDGHVEIATAHAPLSFVRGARIDLPGAGSAPDGTLAVVLHPKVALRDGRHAHNPWLQELPDPISKVSWDNCAALAPDTAARLGFADGDLVTVEASADGEPGTLQLPVLVQRGQAEDTVAIALGYGRLGTDRFSRIAPDWIQGKPTVQPGGTIGKNAAPLLAFEDGHVSTTASRVRLVRTGRSVELARTQIYDSLEVPKHLAPKGGEVRPHVQETTLAAWRMNPAAGKPHAHPTGELWEDDHPYEGRHWGLAIDLSACTGCAACVIACQSENNIPVVGRDEVRRQREMHWLRVDRFFRGDDDDIQAAHQPMMCQQCDHAPCETVCPVLATVHSSEGLNQQVYNRCVGTRYCSNNCPYKVRRFNWFDYPHDDRLQNLALNPDVTVRSRGVMEKCTFCVQRIQEVKAAAQREGRVLRDGEIQPACMQVCPAGAVVFGDTNDQKSEVTAQSASPRAYRVLEELGVRPSVAYLRRVKDREAEDEHHG